MRLIIQAVFCVVLMWICRNHITDDYDALIDEYEHAETVGYIEEEEPRNV